jgi:hypothetical protein
MTLSLLNDHVTPSSLRFISNYERDDVISHPGDFSEVISKQAVSQICKRVVTEAGFEPAPED